MSIWRNSASGLRPLFPKEEVEQEMDEELRGFAMRVRATRLLCPAPAPR
jgi:hypothetical protein